jgi:hypothetical protein
MRQQIRQEIEKGCLASGERLRNLRNHLANDVGSYFNKNEDVSKVIDKLDYFSQDNHEQIRQEP